MILVGEIVNTHGLKGEVKVNSNFRHKNAVLKPKQIIFIGNNKEPVEIERYRQTRNADLLLLKEHNNINEVLIYKGERIYVERDSLSKDLIISEDLIDFDVIYEKKTIGKITGFFDNKIYDVFIIEGNQKNYLPHVKELMKKIDFEKKQIVVDKMPGLFYEN